MTLAFTSIVQNQNGSWTFSWASTGAAYYRVILYGVQKLKVTTLSYTSPVDNQYLAFPPPVEVVPLNTLALSEQFQPYLLIQWYGERQAKRYYIQQYINAVWQTIVTISESGQWIYSYRTQTEVDGQTYSYQVIAEDDFENQATPRQFIQVVVCPPAPIDSLLSLSYNKPNITIAL